MGAGIMTITVDPIATFPPQPLLSRYAECSMWLARYMERIENLARIIDITETFVRSGATDGWKAIIQINADEERFFKAHRKYSAEQVISFYVIERDNPTSIAALAHAARENARSLRPIISVEMWAQLNVFTNFIRDLKINDIRPGEISTLCTKIKEECQTHTGITEGTLYRDQVSVFYNIGRFLERADQITRLIDIKYHTLLPSEAGVGSEVDISQWSALLRSAAGYHAYRRVMAGDIRPSSIIGFLLKSAAFPRSLTTNLRLLHNSLTQLRRDYRLLASSNILERVEHLSAVLESQTATQIIVSGLHEFCDWIQSELQQVQNEIAQAFWPTEPVVAKTLSPMPPLEPFPAFSSQTQTQSQT
ncbi:alpha-E domain-containing protein [Acetobacter sicerae]|uniref:Alpha-E domain-containing protein n=1 Tax=Acetobacter sicerae TaxID=85325 RepID=A0ABS8VVY1_9PROT|nr:alpha-E domain-containing protein [Acetobacter sicerae]MCE0745142.1 alpha-E domain-containing protein [Acetobacter sicerae]NHN90658.1 alpha-E domain-containing protein [Acetobacter sicerae]